MFMPTLNPEGFPNIRENDSGDDINRHWVGFAPAENQAVGVVLKSYAPHVVFGFHEMTSRPEQFTIDSSAWSEVPPQIASLGSDLLTAIEGGIIGAGYTSGPYPGGDDARFLTNSSAFQNRIPVLVEVKGQGVNATLTFKDAVAGCKVIMDSAFTWHSSNLAAVQKAVAESALDAVQEGENQAAISMPSIASPPKGYILTSAQLSTVLPALEACSLVYYELATLGQYYVPMAQANKRMLPHLMDSRSAVEVVSATPVDTTPSLLAAPVLVNLRWQEQGSSGLAGVKTAINADEISIESLESGTAFEWSVQSQDVDETSAWSANNTFTTLADAGTYNLEWRDVATQTTTQVMGITDLFYDLTGLSASTAYEFRVQEDDGGTTSDWSEWYQFTTTAAGGGTEINLTLAPIQQHTQAEAVAAAQVSAVDAVILSQSANSEIASVSQIAMASGVESQQISQSQQASLALSALLGSVEAQQLTSAEALDVSIVQPDSLTVAVVEQLLQAQPVSSSQSALLEAVIGQSRTQALAVQVAADYTLMAVTAEQMAQVEALEILDGTGLQVVTLEQSTSSGTASVTLLALVDGTAVEQGTNANLVVTAATLAITASQAEQLTEAEIADIVGSAMFLDPRELTVSRTTTGFTVRRTTPTYTMQFKHSVH